MSTSTHKTSIIIPAFNEQSIIGSTIADVANHFHPFEIIVVSDGSTDGTDDIVRQSPARLIRLPENTGKGAAVRRGVMEAGGDIIAFIDADMPYRPENLDRAIELVRSGAADIAVGARDLPQSETDHSYPMRRRLAGRTLSLLIRLFLIKEITDTQCGLKAFRRDAARSLFAESRLNGFGFDFEVLYLATSWGLRIARVPVALSHRHESRVRLIRDSAIMLRDLIRVRLWGPRQRPSF
jgi:dolichyl-phosphate beta-glucosyltransferase